MPRIARVVVRRGGRTLRDARGLVMRGFAANRLRFGERVVQYLGRDCLDMNVHPLIFQPIFKGKIWGGRRLENRFGKALPPVELIGESWEIADLEDDQSVVREGPAEGRTLECLVKEWGTALTGRAPLVDGRFPLLIKFLDAHDTLSVQVHPTAEVAAKLGGRVRVKHEAWYVLDAAEDGFIYRGVEPGVDAAALRRAIDEGRVESCLNRISVKKGDCYYLPSGTLHALGAGVMVAEVQTPSEVTYRVYDFNRIDASTGKRRELHVDQAFACISFDPGPIAGEERSHVAGVWTTVTRLVTCDAFLIERVRMVDGVEQAFCYGELVIWIVLEGRGKISYKSARQPMTFSAGDTVLLPAGLEEGRVKTSDDCLWLEVTVPIPSDLADYQRPDRATLRQDTAPTNVVELNLPNKTGQN